MKIFTTLLKVRRLARCCLLRLETCCCNIHIMIMIAPKQFFICHAGRTDSHPSTSYATGVDAATQYPAHAYVSVT